MIETLAALTGIVHHLQQSKALRRGGKGGFARRNHVADSAVGGMRRLEPPSLLLGAPPQRGRQPPHRRGLRLGIEQLCPLLGRLLSQPAGVQG